MALIADMNGAKPVTGAYLKIENIFGSKKTGWTCFVGVYEKEDSYAPLETFSVHTPFEDGKDPYPLLYKTISELSFLSNITNHVSVEAIPESDSKALEELVEVAEKQKVPRKKAK